MSNEKKYQVFISSTYKDLVEAREKVTKVILDLYHLPVGMEMFSADDDDQWKIITDAIDVSDYYVLILGHRYGSVTNKGISYTEKEYDYAKAKKKPILSFIREREALIKNSDRETNPDFIAKLDKFIAKASKDKYCSFWSEISELETKIAIALPKAMGKHGGIGWVRGDQASGELAEEIGRLSKENGILREENERLRQSVDVRKPELILTINEINGSNIDEFIHLKIRELVDSERFKLPEKIPQDQITNTISFHQAEQIQRFNHAISMTVYRDIVNINKKIQELYQLDQGLKEFKIQISNNGSLLAKNVDIEIELPEIVRIIDDLSSENVAALKFIAKQGIVYLPYPDGYVKPDFHTINAPKTISRGGAIPRRSNILIKRNILTINLESLLHSKNKELQKLYLYPLERGEAVIKIKVICEEYSEPQYTEIPIKVV